MINANTKLLHFNLFNILLQFYSDLPLKLLPDEISGSQNSKQQQKYNPGEVYRHACLYSFTKIRNGSLKCTPSNIPAP